jgi:hypothetical protein
VTIHVTKATFEPTILRDPETYRYVTRRSQTGRSTFVEGPARTEEGACFQRLVICQCDGFADHPERAKEIAELLNAAHAAEIAERMAKAGI